MAYLNRIAAVPLESADSADLGSGYVAINPDGLPRGCCIISIINNSGVDVTVSYDGSTAHDYVPTMTVRTLNFQTNASPTSNQAFLPKGTIVWVSATESSTGLIYLSAYYQPTDSIY
jgi:hypothetical protein